jgi:hypothetical protein
MNPTEHPPACLDCPPGGALAADDRLASYRAARRRLDRCLSGRRHGVRSTRTCVRNLNHRDLTCAVMSTLGREEVRAAWRAATCDSSASRPIAVNLLESDTRSKRTCTELHSSLLRTTRNDQETLASGLPQ